MSLAWHVAAISRQEKLPSLDALLRRHGRRQTVKEHRAMLEVLSAQYGIPLRRARG